MIPLYRRDIIDIVSISGTLAELIVTRKSVEILLHWNGVMEESWQTWARDIHLEEMLVLERKVKGLLVPLVL